MPASSVSGSSPVMVSDASLAVDFELVDRQAFVGIPNRGRARHRERTAVPRAFERLECDGRLSLLPARSDCRRHRSSRAADPAGRDHASRASRCSLKRKRCQIEIVGAHLERGGPGSHQTDQRIGVEVEALCRRRDRRLVVLRDGVDDDATQLRTRRLFRSIPSASIVEIDRGLRVS